MAWLRIELIAGACHGHVEQAPLLCALPVRVVRGRPARQGRRERQGIPPRREREASLSHADDEDSGELEAFRLVNGQDRDRLDGLRRILHRGVLPGVDEGLKGRHEVRQPRVAQEVGLRLEDLEEASHATQGTIVPGFCARHQGPQPAALTQVVVQDHRRGPLVDGAQ